MSYAEKEIKDEIKKLFRWYCYEDIARVLKLYCRRGTRKRIISISEFEEFPDDISMEARLDWLMWKSIQQVEEYGGEEDAWIDPLGSGSPLEEMEMEALNYLTEKKESINQRLGAYTTEILWELVMRYEFNISYAEIGRRLDISKRTVQRRIVDIQTDPLIPMECPFIFKIIEMKSNDKRTKNLGQYAQKKEIVTKQDETDTILEGIEVIDDSQITQEVCL